MNASNANWPPPTTAPANANESGSALAQSIAFDPTMIDRPDPKLFKYYVLISLMAGPLSPIVLIGLWFRYATLRYKFDADGISMRRGVFFRSEVNLTYRRIQDIHLTRNLLQRWMGLATISLQTAAGNSAAEMAIEGVLQAEELRNYLYAKMRGAKNEAEGMHLNSTDETGFVQVSQDDRVTTALLQIRDAMQRLVERQAKV